MNRVMRPVVFRWQKAVVEETGEVRDVMVPDDKYAALADRQFVEGEDYPLVILEARSRASHNHYFAAIHDAWSNLTDDVRFRVVDGKRIDRFPSQEHLRKWALVECGYATETNFVFDTPRHARENALKMRALDTLAVITVKGNIVRIFQADSQSAAAMPNGKFKESKNAVLDKIAALVGVSAEELNREAGSSA